MKASTVVFLLVPLAASVDAALADNVKAQVEGMKASGKPEVFAVENGIYTCTSCQPEIKIKANGESQTVAGSSDYNEMVVRVLNPHSIEIVQQLNHKNRAFWGYNVSADGKTLTVSYDDYSTGKEAKGGYTATRVGAAPAGALPVSGSWKIEQINDGNAASAARAH